MTKNRGKPLSVNMLLSVINSGVNTMFPLVVFPHASKILGVQLIGKYYFINSIMSYFILIAGLGVNTYAIREGARFRNSKSRLEKFANEVFSINVFSTMVSGLLLILVTILVPQMRNELMLVMTASLQMITPVIGVEWIFAVYEDYLFPACRNICIKLAAVIALKLFVKDKDCLLIFAIVMSGSVALANLINWISAKHRLKIKIVNIVWNNEHIKPIILLFAMSLSVSLYVSSDTTILGFICDLRTVGIYTVSTKVYTVVKTIICSVLGVSIPRLSYFLGQKKMWEYSDTAESIYQLLLFLVMPVITGIICLSEEIVTVISGTDYLAACPSLNILAFALVPGTCSYFWGQCVLVPARKEKILLKATSMGAVINVGLNFMLIPYFAETAAAITTVISETVVFIYCKNKSLNDYKPNGTANIFFKTMIGCLGIIVLITVCKQILRNAIGVLLLSVILSFFAYLCIGLCIGNNALIKFIKKGKNNWHD